MMKKVCNSSDNYDYREELHTTRKEWCVFMRVKFVIGTDLVDLNNALNDYLSSIPDNDVNIKYELDKVMCIVEHKGNGAVCRCCDCQYYDPSEDRRRPWGLCQRRGERTKFSHKACEDYEDVRC